MKSKHIICFYIFLAGLCLTATSCEDMLTPDMERYAERASGTDTVNDYLGVVKNLQEVIEQHQLLGDLRSDLAVSTPYTSDSINGIINFSELVNGQNKLLNRAAYYKVINQCNFYLSVVDMDAKKNNIYYMRKEAAQVRVIRAWIYMQLVQAYGSVPFITEPVTEANSGLDTKSPTATADNLLDLLLQSGGLEEAYNIEKSQGLPQYGNFNTGDVTIPHAVTIFPAELVLADLYLLRGQAGDFDMAANLYYQFLKEYQRKYSYHLKSTETARYVRFDKDGVDQYTENIEKWITPICPITNLSTGKELITVIPGAANHTFGTMLTHIPNIYGFDIHSYNNQEGETTSGSVSIVANYKTRQVQPSLRYENINTAQQYLIVESDDQLHYAEKVGDARINGTAPLVQSEDGDGRFIQKYGANYNTYNGTANAWGFGYRYCIPVYRYTQVLLRFAEAVNRAGFPRHAYAILTSGTSNDVMPTLTDSLIFNADSTAAERDYYFIEAGDAEDVSDVKKLLFLTEDEMRRAASKPYLDFKGSVWENVGIHTLGSGVFSFDDTERTYDKVVVAQRVEDEKTRTGIELPSSPAVVKSTVMENHDILKFGEPEVVINKDIEVTTTSALVASEAEINAVETLIADEMALEMAFEGTRLYDLIRVARHMDRTHSGYGTNWLAWSIARRSVEAAPYENPQEMDMGLFNFLLTPSNWYLPNP